MFHIIKHHTGNNYRFTAALQNGTAAFAWSCPLPLRSGPKKPATI